MLLHISRSVQVPAYEMTEKMCRECGRLFRGLHWTKPPCASQRLEFVFQGVVLGWCGGCLEREADRWRRAEEAMRSPRPAIDTLHRPSRTTRDADQVPF